jgi:hypothetical protein
MVEKGYEYAYVSEYEKDEEFVVSGLWDTTKKFMKEYNVTPVSLANKLKQNEWALDMFYTNFEIAKFSFFRSKEYMSYYNYLDQTGNIYYRRWGDAPIHWLGVHMFLPDANIWCIKNITYQHGSWMKNTQFVDMNSVAMEPEPFKAWALSTIVKNGTSNG